MYFVFCILKLWRCILVFVFCLHWSDVFWADVFCILNTHFPKYFEKYLNTFSKVFDPSLLKRHHYIRRKPNILGFGIILCLKSNFMSGKALLCKILMKKTLKTWLTCTWLKASARGPATKIKEKGLWSPKTKILLKLFFANFFQFWAHRI